MNNNYEKDFDGWNKIKKELNDISKAPKIHNGEIWWCSIGVNVGMEQDGRDKVFWRPVLIYCKINDELFWGIPFSTKYQRNEKFSETLMVDGKITHALLAQKRILSSKRLNNKIGKIPNHTYNRIIQKVNKIKPYR